MTSKNSESPPSAKQLRIGFVPLLDAMPLIAAFELGYFADEQLSVELERQIGWGNVRDKLVYGHLDASHALVGMPPLSVLQTDRYTEALVTIMALGTGGDAITLSRNLTDVGVDSASSLARRLKPRPPRPPVLAHVFGCSVHHYLLRDWLTGGGVDADRDINLIVLPPMQMATQMRIGTVDGFCAGEPWNTLAEAQGLGRVVAMTTDLLPAHPDKVLAVSRRWLALHPGTATALIRATLRACDFCDDNANRAAIAEMLARPEYLNMSADVLMQSLTPDRWRRSVSSAFEPARSCAMTSTFPSITHGAWLMSQMVRWGHLPSDTNIEKSARLAVQSSAYRKAAADVGLLCPPDDAPAMRFKTTQSKRIGDRNAVLV